MWKRNDTNHTSHETSESTSSTGGTGGLIYAAVSIAASQPVSEMVKPVLQPPQPSFERAIAAVGLVEPSSETVNLGTLRSGIVSEVLVKAGDTVEKPAFAATAFR